MAFYILDEWQPMEEKLDEKKGNQKSCLQCGGSHVADSATTLEKVP